MKSSFINPKIKFIYKKRFVKSKKTNLYTKIEFIYKNRFYKYKNNKKFIKKF